MSNVTFAAQINIVATEDATGNILINRSFTPSLDSQGVLDAQYVLVGTGAFNLFGNVKGFYVRNLGGGGSGSILIAVQPTGGSLLPLCVLGPGDFIGIFPTSTGAPAVAGISQGFTLVTATASSGTVPTEYGQAF